MPDPPAGNPLGSPFIELQSIDSTNNYALERIHAGLAQHGEAIFAHEQLAGKGQFGRIWTADKDANILLSVVIRPEPISIGHQFWLSAVVSSATREFFARYAGEDTKIKWPNDLYWQDRKAGGILIESVIRSQPEPAKPGIGANNNPQLSHSNSVEADNIFSPWKWAVIGIGININQTFFPAELPNPVSLKQITGKSFEIIELAKDLCQALDRKYHQLLDQGFEEIYRQYLSHLYKKDEKLKFRVGTRLFEGVLKTVSPQGKLVILHAIEEEFDHGQVELVL